MSDPKRYEHMSDGMGRWFINPKTGKLAPYGEYVMSSDYARLKAENQGRQAENSVLAIENDCLKAEVEQLQKLVGTQKSIDESIDAWIESKRNAAKEGKPSV